MWAQLAASSEIDKPFDHALADGEEPFGLRVIDIERIDEIGLWLPAQQALVFGDAMIRRGERGAADVPAVLDSAARRSRAVT